MIPSGTPFWKASLPCESPAQSHGGDRGGFAQVLSTVYFVGPLHYRGHQSRAGTVMRSQGLHGDVEATFKEMSKTSVGNLVVLT